MSIGLAVQMIGYYTRAYHAISSKVQHVQEELARVAWQSRLQGGVQNNQGVEGLQTYLAVLTFLQGLFKDFLDYWKQVLKDTLGMLKSLNELAQGAR